MSCYRVLVRGWAYLCAYLIMTVSLLTGLASVGAQEYGTQKNLEFVLDDEATVSIPFVLCSPPPAGTLGEPNGKPFLIGTTELSFRALEQIAPEVFTKLTDRWRQLSETAGRELQQMLAESGSYPAIGLELSEAAEIIAQCSARIKRNPLSEDALSELILRIPSAEEWEHAMRSGRTREELPLFNDWNDLSAATAKEAGQIEELWRNKFPGQPFNGTQSEVGSLIEKYAGNPDAPNYQLMLQFFLNNLGRGSWADPAPLESSRFTVEGTRSSGNVEWGVQGAHRGYPEWILLAANQDAATRGWSEHQRAVQSEEAGNSGPQFSLAGALRTGAFAGDNAPAFWSSLVLGGGPKTTGTSRVGAHSQKTVEERWAEDYYVAMRIVALETLRPDWFVFVRKTATADTPSAVRRVELDEFQLAIQRLSTEPKSDLNIVKFYQALVRYQSNNTVEASKIIREIAAASNANNSTSAAADRNALRDLLRGSSSANSPPKPAASTKRPAEQIYLESLAFVMENDGMLK